MSIGNSVFYVLINFYNDVMRRYFYVYFVDIELFKKLKFWEVNLFKVIWLIIDRKGKYNFVYFDVYIILLKLGRFLNCLV